MKGTVTVRPRGYLLVVLVAGVVSVGATSRDALSQATSSAPAQQGSAEQQLRAAHERLLDAARKDDKAVAREMMADEVSWVHPTARVSTATSSFTP